MALHASWVHGNAVRAEWVGDNLANVQGQRWDQSSGDVGWSNVNGLPRGFGTTFRGKRSVVSGFGGSLTSGSFNPANPFEFSQKGYFFHVPIPTPVLVAGQRASLLRVFLLWEATANVAPVAIHVFDGVQRIAALPVTGTRGLVGRNGIADLVDGTTRFNLSTPRPVLFGISVTAAVAFMADGDISFAAAGADFDV